MKNVCESHQGIHDPPTSLHSILSNDWHFNLHSLSKQPMQQAHAHGTHVQQTCIKLLTVQVGAKASSEQAHGNSEHTIHPQEAPSLTHSIHHNRAPQYGHL